MVLLRTAGAGYALRACNLTLDGIAGLPTQHESAGQARRRFVRAAPTGLVLDIRGLTPAMRRPVVFAVVDKMLELDCMDSIVVICDHDPSGLGYQLDLRRESRGKFEFDCDQRLDGAWVALIRRKI
jgi:uncharacterized protein (DUF2249 family)